MSRIFLLFVGTGLGNALSGAVPATSPTSTSHTRTDDPAAATTPAVQGLPQLQSAFSESPQLCGYLGGDSWNPYTCPGTSTCLWNSHLWLVGCGEITSVDFYTSCVSFQPLGGCDERCQGDASILRCAADTPYCGTVTVGPDDTYSILQCQKDEAMERHDVQLTYQGQSSLGTLPRYLGDDGEVTYGTIASSDPATQYLCISQPPTPIDSPSPMVFSLVITSTIAIAVPSREYQGRRLFGSRLGSGLGVVALVAVCLGTVMILFAIVAAIWGERRKKEAP